MNEVTGDPGPDGLDHVEDHDAPSVRPWPRHRPDWTTVPTTYAEGVEAGSEPTRTPGTARRGVGS